MSQLSDGRGSRSLAALTLLLLCAATSSMQFGCGKGEQAQPKLSSAVANERATFASKQAMSDGPRNPAGERGDGVHMDEMKGMGTMGMGMGGMGARKAAPAPDGYVESSSLAPARRTNLLPVEPEKETGSAQKSQAPQVWHHQGTRPTFARVYLGEGNSLELVSLQVTVTIEGPRARTTVDHIFRNPHDRQLEGSWCWRGRGTIASAIR